MAFNCFLLKNINLGLTPVWRARKFTEFCAQFMPKDPMPVKIPDSPPSTPESEDSDSLPEPEVEDELALEGEVGPYFASTENLGNFKSNSHEIPIDFVPKIIENCR